MTSTNLIKTNRRRTLSLSLEDTQLQHKSEETLKKSLSSTIKIPTLSGISNCDLTNDGDNFDNSLEDLNKEIEKLCPFNSNMMLPQLKLANSRYCDIFSRQSMESDENSSPDDEERINFLATIPQTSCDVVQLVPKKPVITSEHNAMYQPRTNTIIQLKQSTFSAFRDLSEIKKSKIDDKTDNTPGGSNDDIDDNTEIAGAASSHIPCEEDQQTNQ